VTTDAYSNAHFVGSDLIGVQAKCYGFLARAADAIGARSDCDTELGEVKA
jgi:hypothetical protein